MLLKREPVKALQIGFLILLIISAAQVAWWMADHVNHARDVRDRFARLYDADAQAVTAVFAGRTDRLGELLPHLNIVSGLATVRVETVDALEQEAASRINRFIWEGGFFLVVLIGGMAILTRTIRRDAELRQALTSSRNCATCSGASRSCQSSFTITTGARSQAPRHSTSISVNVPVGSVSPGAMPSAALNASVTRSAPSSAHESVRQTFSTYVPTGFV
jgi:hypothetical protein